LDCDRATCFVIDRNKNELWSKVAQGTHQIIKVKLGQGIAGKVALNKELINITNVYANPDFNPHFDKLTNYKTRNMLVCPIMEKDKCMGVL
jgi:putative methionine-R-sulfoxide reductase with GAF domain